jgi:tripartite-type tricarboxylate transporter receptor subunit TctC
MDTPIRSSKASASILIAGVLFTGLTCAAAQQDYPNQPIKVVVPILPGAAADVLPRIIGEKLAVKFGQPVVFENRPGANSNIGAQAAAAAAPDGYTLLATPPPPLVANAFLNPRLGFDPTAFVPVSVLAALPNALVSGPDTPYSSIDSMIRFAKANPNKLTYASPGVGSSPHLAMEWLKQLAGIEITHVPYNGLAPAMNDVLGGHVDMVFSNTFNVLPLLRDGKLRVMGVDSESRIPELPDSPAISEIFPGYVVTTWFAVVAPPRTPMQIAEKLSSGIAEALRQPDVAKKLSDYSAKAIGSSPTETDDFIKRERERWYQVIAAARLTKSN